MEKPEKETSEDTENDSRVSELLEAIESLSFGHIPKFTSLDLSSLIGPLAKNYELLIPIAEKSIRLFYSGSKEAAEEAFHSLEMGKLLITMLQCGTKPFDAIMWIGVRLAKEEDTFGKYFSFERGETCSNDNQVRAITLIAANWILFVTRGSFPLQQIIGRRNPLPKFVSIMLHPYLINSEWALLSNTSSFDMKHINVQNLLIKADMKGWDEIIMNRMHLGVAGHKTIKLAGDLVSHYKEGWDKQAPVLSIMVSASKLIESGFYPTLHPSTKIVATKFPKFYSNSLKMIFDMMKGSNASKYEILDNIPYLKNDEVIRKKSLGVMPTNWKIWKADEFNSVLGDLVSFSSANRISDTEGLPHMLKLEDIDLPEDAMSKLEVTKPSEENVRSDLGQEKITDLVIGSNESDEVVQKPTPVQPSTEVPSASSSGIKSTPAIKVNFD